MEQYVGGIGSMVLYALLTGTFFLLVAAVLKIRLGWVSALSLAGFLWSLVVIALVTLVPIDAIDLAIPADERTDECSLDYGGPAPDGFWIFAGTQRTLNTVLFVPAGALMVLAAARWRGWWLAVPFGLAGLAAYSIAIELTQLALARIGRACDITDMADNIAGAVIGAAIGVVLAVVLRPWRRRSTRH